jgi:hypothetical protein
VIGVGNHTALARVMSKLPNASFEDATDEVGLVRDVRGNVFIWSPLP